jgi:hypothetical protein
VAVEDGRDRPHFAKAPGGKRLRPISCSQRRPLRANGGLGPSLGQMRDVEDARATVSAVGKEEPAE